MLLPFTKWTQKMYVNNTTFTSGLSTQLQLSLSYLLIYCTSDLKIFFWTLCTASLSGSLSSSTVFFTKVNAVCFIWYLHREMAFSIKRSKTESNKCQSFCPGPSNHWSALVLTKKSSYAKQDTCSISTSSKGLFTPLLSKCTNSSSMLSK